MTKKEKAPVNKIDACKNTQPYQTVKVSKGRGENRTGRIKNNAERKKKVRVAEQNTS